jgi:hypothetical protein
MTYRQCRATQAREMTSHEYVTAVPAMPGSGRTAHPGDLSALRRVWCAACPAARFGQPEAHSR